MSFLQADLPSSDEEDDDYRPDQDKTAPAEDRAEAVAMQHERPSSKRPRGPGDQEDMTVEDLADEGDHYDPRKQIKKAKVDHLWLLLNSKPGSTPPLLPKGLRHMPASTSATPVAAGAKAQAPIVGPSASVSLATLCRTVGAKERKKTDTDVLWMRSLGITPARGGASGTPATPLPASTSAHQTAASAPPKAAGGFAGLDSLIASMTGAETPRIGQQGTGSSAEPPAGEGAGPSRGAVISEDARAVAAAAIAAARESGGVGAVRAANKVTVTETRRFAGKDIQVAVQVDRGSKEAARAAERAAMPVPVKSGLDAFLAEVEKKKKVNVLDKTKADWQQLKASDATLEEELEAHKRSGGQYLEKVDFLKRAEVREYEQERDKRLQSDVRNRGRM